MSLTIAELTMENFKCFAGETRLALEPKAYGIFARDLQDRDRSNWLGKSSLTEAVDYALTGRRPRDARHKSDWITRGEEKGSVEVIFSDGARVRRSMSRKGSEKLYFFPPGDPEHGAVQEAAQQKIDEHLGLAKEDAGTWCFRQGEMSALLRMDPAPRLKMFSAWFRLEKLEECQALAALARGAVAKQVEEARKGLEAWRQRRQDRLDLVNVPIDLLDDALSEAVREYERAETDVALYAGAERDAAERKMLAADAARYDAICEEGRKSAQWLAEMPGKESLETEYRRIDAEKQAAVAEASKADVTWRAVSEAAAGNFDGRCPIAGASCPSAAFVTEATSLNRHRREEAVAGLQEWSAALRGAEDRLHLVRSKLRDRESLEGRISGLRIQARELQPRRARWQALGDVPAQPPEVAAGARMTLQRAEGRMRELEAARTFLIDTNGKIAAGEAEVERLEKVAEIPTAAALIFERARREIAEGVLAEIEGHANEMLSAIGADLAVAISWGRDADGLADACAACGAAYPASRRVKHCARCGAERGQKVVEKLDIEPSRRSGAADDFGGVAVTLGASRWLREDRGSAWAAATLDEATSQMDAANRRAFAVRLPEVLRLAGFSQALVVSHHRETLEALPGRIEIVSSGGVSKARVVA